MIDAVQHHFDVVNKKHSRWIYPQIFNEQSNISFLTVSLHIHFADKISNLFKWNICVTHTSTWQKYIFDFNEILLDIQIQQLMTVREKNHKRFFFLVRIDGNEWNGLRVSLYLVTGFQCRIFDWNLFLTLLILLLMMILQINIVHIFVISKILFQRVFTFVVNSIYMRMRNDFHSKFLHWYLTFHYFHSFHIKYSFISMNMIL